MPAETARIARAAFPKGNSYLRLRDEPGSLYTDEAFADLFPTHGQPAEAPWRLAVITVLQFAEMLSDRQAAEAVRARLDWKSLLGLSVEDPGSDSFIGRWLMATLTPVTKVVAYEGQTAVRTMLALRGIPRFPTPTGIFSIVRRVPNETNDSIRFGIPHNSPYGYDVKNVLYTQYFAPEGASFHDNSWSWNFGGVGSHGCLGLSLADRKWLWDWASIGVPG